MEGAPRIPGRQGPPPAPCLDGLVVSLLHGLEEENTAPTGPPPSCSYPHTPTPPPGEGGGGVAGRCPQCTGPRRRCWGTCGTPSPRSPPSSTRRCGRPSTSPRAPAAAGGGREPGHPGGRGVNQMSARGRFAVVCAEPLEKGCRRWSVGEGLCVIRQSDLSSPPAGRSDLGEGRRVRSLRGPGVAPAVRIAGFGLLAAFLPESAPAGRPAVAAGPPFTSMPRAELRGGGQRNRQGGGWGAEDGILNKVWPPGRSIPRRKLKLSLGHTYFIRFSWYRPLSYRRPGPSRPIGPLFGITAGASQGRPGSPRTTSGTPPPWRGPPSPPPSGPIHSHPHPDP